MTYTETRKAAEAAGFKPGIEVNAKGYWKALRAFCAQKGIFGPWKRGVVETKKQRHARKERERRARIKAAKG